MHSYGRGETSFYNQVLTSVQFIFPRASNQQMGNRPSPIRRLPKQYCTTNPCAIPKTFHELEHIRTTLCGFPYNIRHPTSPTSPTFLAFLTSKISDIFVCTTSNISNISDIFVCTTSDIRHCCRRHNQVTFTCT